jgi:hypothetical protein
MVVAIVFFESSLCEYFGFKERKLVSFSISKHVKTLKDLYLQTMRELYDVQNVLTFSEFWKKFGDKYGKRLVFKYTMGNTIGELDFSKLEGDLSVKLSCRPFYTK